MTLLTKYLSWPGTAPDAFKAPLSIKIKAGTEAEEIQKLHDALVNGMGAITNTLLDLLAEVKRYNAFIEKCEAGMPQEDIDVFLDQRPPKKRKAKR